MPCNPANDPVSTFKISFVTIAISDAVPMQRLFGERGRSSG